MVIAVAARITIPIPIHAPLLIATVPPLMVRRVTALALAAQLQPRPICLAATVAVLPHLFGELGFGLLNAPLALFHALIVPLTIFVLVISILCVRDLRNRSADEQQQRTHRGGCKGRPLNLCTNVVLR
ncbi:MAG TPA: hypothetical protein VGU63_15525 [Candidatus Acidoferrales bacterium]|nr:hypothetical protein [Candidatus Acidoferrales bacterium]